MKRTRTAFLLLFLLLTRAGFSQLDSLVRDSTPLPVDEFFELVKNNHPMAVQARLIRERARAEKLKASGNFDPKLFSDVSQKYFNETHYYQLQNSGLEIPAWFGLSAKAGYELNEGVYLNNQNTVPGSGLWYANLSLTVGQGLFIDQRRAMLKQARLLQESAEYEVQSALNEVLNNALDAYWQWYASYQTLQVYSEALTLAEFRFYGVREGAIIGDRAMIDTLEAAIQVQDRRIKLQNARANYIAETNNLQTYLWLDGQIPLEIGTATFPVYRQPDLVNLPPDWLAEHPQLRFYDLKFNRLEIEQRLNRERIKPQVDVNYKFLNQPTRDDFFANYAINNYSWGLSASFPLFLRKERAEITKTQVKLSETDLNRKLKDLEIRRKVEALQEQFNLISSQLLETRQMTRNYQRLLEAETTKFQNGESSLFVVNTRELRYLNSQEKLIELEGKLNRISAKLRAAAGILQNGL